MAVRPTRSDLGARLRAALSEPPPGASEHYEDVFFDENERERGEVFGAQTGRAKRAISADDLEDVRWDATRPYPQIMTSSTDPERPRTIASGYDPKNLILRVTFRNGDVYEYLGVSARIWSTFQRVPSPGRYVDQVLDQFPYRPALPEV